MVSEGASPNDPVFFNHHTMVDCLLDKYLKNTTEGYATLDLLEIDCLLDMVQMTVWYLFSLCILMLICIRLDQNLAFNLIFGTLQHPIVHHHNLMVPCSRLLSTMCYLQPSSYLPLPTFSFRLSSQLNEQTFFPSFL